MKSRGCPVLILPEGQPPHPLDHAEGNVFSHQIDGIHKGQRFVIVGDESVEIMRNLYELASRLWI